MTHKFKVGDRLILLTDIPYAYTKTEVDIINKGDIVTVDKVGMLDNNILYGFVGDCETKALYVDVERNFELVRPTLKRLLDTI